eukprot:XP_001690310.1 predicted protein [Chlamydomonas reinhardtii]
MGLVLANDTSLDLSNPASFLQLPMFDVAPPSQMVLRNIAINVNCSVVSALRDYVWTCGSWRESWW